MPRCNDGFDDDDEDEEEELDDVEVKVEEEVEVVEEDDEVLAEEVVTEEVISEIEEEKEESSEEGHGRAPEEYIEQKDKLEDGEGETEVKCPPVVFDGQSKHSSQMQASLKEEAKDFNGDKSPVSKESNSMKNHVKSAFDSATISEVLGRGSPAVEKINSPRNIVRPVFDAGSIAELDHGKCHVSMETEYPGNHLRSVLESVSNAKSPVARKNDISENHARSTLVRSRSPSANDTLDTSNKRPSVICDFYAKGWCIKGNSCRFSHHEDCSQSATNGRSLRRECMEDSDVSSSNLLHRALIRAYGQEGPQMSEVNSGVNSRKRDMVSHEANVDLLNEATRHTVVSGSSLSHEPLYCSASSSIGLRMYDPSYNCDWDLSIRKLPGHFESVTSYSLEGTLGYHSNASLTFGALPSSYVTASDKSVLLGDKKQTITSSWEPSVPFRSSICPVAPALLSTSDQYDPLIHSVEPAKGESNLPVPRENASPDYRDFKSGGSLSLSHESGADIVHVKGLGISVGTESVPEIIEYGHKNSICEGLRSSPGYASNLYHVKKNLPERSLKVQEDRGSYYKEPKMLKVFRSAVADFVKDLLKPSWLGGHLSKDAHKLIVKKAVEKVCGALQSHQIPNGSESTNQYFFSNRPKLVKLVEGYVEKYARS